VNQIDFKNINTGLIGEVLDQIHPLVESNKESLLIQLLACFGNCVGRNPYFLAAADKHFCNLYVLLVGKSARGRKGQSLNMIKSLFESVDSEWLHTRIIKGLSSGEGLIFKVCDEVQTDSLSGVQIQIGNADRRLMCIETEFSSVLKRTKQDGNTLSQTLRDCWDSITLEVSTKHSPMKATDPMISIIGHTTIAELTRYLNSTEIANGLGNRLIYIKAENDKILPDPPQLNVEIKQYIAKQISESIKLARQQTIIAFDYDAQNYWNDFYRSINHSDCSIVGTLTAREEPQVRRLAMIITLFNGKNLIDLDSLKFAIEIYKYTIQTLKEIYGDTTGDPLTDRIYDLLKASPDGLSKSALSDLLSKNYPKHNLDNSVRLLLSQGRVVLEKHQTNGRPQEILKIVKTDKTQ
jgi:Protein of unknown function (DUF3987)